MLSEFPFKGRCGHNEHVGDQLGAWKVVADPAAHGTLGVRLDGRPDFDEGRDTDAPPPGFVDEPDGGWSDHRNVLDQSTVQTMGIAADSAEEYVGKIPLPIFVGSLVDEEGHPPWATRFIVGVGADQYGRQSREIAAIDVTLLEAYRRSTQEPVRSAEEALYHRMLCDGYARPEMILRNVARWTDDRHS